MKKENSAGYALLLLILFILFPALGIIVAAIYIYSKYKSKLNTGCNHKDAWNEEHIAEKNNVIKTDAKVVSTIIENDPEWTAIKEYRH